MPPELIASFYTLAGDVHPFRPPLISSIPLRQRAEAAGRAGFRGIGLSKDDLEHTRRNMSFVDIASILNDNGLVHNEIELLEGWFAVGEMRQGAEAQRRFILDAAMRLGLRHVKLATSGEPHTSDHIIECFEALCREGAEAGTAVLIEVSPIGRVTSLSVGRQIVEGAAHANGGLLIDLWHVVRSGIKFGDIAALPAHVIHHVELCDGPSRPTGNYIEETVNDRLLCGDGEFDIDGFLHATNATGYRGPFGVEILSESHRRLDVDAAAVRAFKSAEIQFTQ